MRLKQKRVRFNFLTNEFGTYILVKTPIAMLKVPITDNSLYINDKIFAPYQFSRVLYTLIKKAPRGLLFGYFAEIVTEGVGFRFRRYFNNPQILGLTLGLSHSVFCQLPYGIKFRCLKYRLLLYGNDQSLVTSWSLLIRNMRAPDAYKGKGLKFAKEVLTFKPGKLRQR